MQRSVTRWTRDRPHALLVVAVGLAAVHGCRWERDLGPGDDVHPAGFEDPRAETFHGSYLRGTAYALGPCRECHGADYAGGAVGVACSSAGCHESGVEACDTCHESVPTTGSHPAHDAACSTCHPTRTDARSNAHPGGHVEIAFSAVATVASNPSFDPTTRTCSMTHCHGRGEPSWTDSGPLGCNDCHDAPPPSHTRFAGTDSDCGSCHAGASHHVDGILDVATLGCDACHGKGPLGAPAPGLFGAVDSPAVGAHARHLDSTLADRIGKVARCDDCHAVPDELESPGHLDEGAPADVSLRAGETYAPDSRACTVGCHWDRDPGPRWDDASGDARACNGCHAMPPPKTRQGTPHPPAEPTLAVCSTCHTFDPSTHVDGTVDFTW